MQANFCLVLYSFKNIFPISLFRACAAQTKSTFLKLAGPQLVQMFIGDGAKLVRDAFALAKEKAPAIIFIDELDAIGTKRFDSEKAGDREVQRTMLELLNQLDGFSSTADIKVIAATNRVDILDPALLRSGRLDRKIEFPAPTEEARARIMQVGLLTFPHDAQRARVYFVSVSLAKWSGKRISLSVLETRAWEDSESFFARSNPKKCSLPRFFAQSSVLAQSNRTADNCFLLCFRRKISTFPPLFLRSTPAR